MMNKSLTNAQAPIQGKLNKSVQLAEYEGGTTNTTTVHVNGNKITVDAKIDVEKTELELQKANEHYEKIYNAQAENAKAINTLNERVNDIGTVIDERVEPMATKLTQLSSTVTSLNTKTNSLERQLAKKASAMYYDSTGELDESGQSKSYWYMLKDSSYINKDSIISGPYNFGVGGGSGGGGGGSSSITDISITAVDWPSTAAVNATTKINIIWTSFKSDVPTGNGTISLYIDDSLKVTQKNTPQGEVELDITKYLTEGTHSVEVRVTDAYGNVDKVIQDITMVNIYIESAFNADLIFHNEIEYYFRPYGEGVTKTVHFIVDSKEVGTKKVSSSGEEVNYYIHNLTHGAHSLEVYFTCNINGNEVESNTLNYDLIFEVTGDTTPIITSTFNSLEQEQYNSFTIPYRVYTPNYAISKADLYINDELVSTLSVNQDTQYWEYKPYDAGIYVFKIQSGITSRIFTVTVSESEIKVEAVKESLSLYLTSTGRSNSEEHKEIWEDSEHGVSCTLTNFNFKSDGWIQDTDGNTVLRVSGNARVEIPYQIFNDDATRTGKTIEFEFASSDVRDYETILADCRDYNESFKKRCAMTEIADRHRGYTISSFDTDVFKAKVTGTNTYTFTYNSGRWEFGNAIVDLADYGIAISEVILIPNEVFEDGTVDPTEYPYLYDGDRIIIDYSIAGRGFYLTPQMAVLSSQQSEISTQYKEDDHVRLAFVIEKNTETRIVSMFINGIMCSATQYPINDSFSQLSPKSISIGSNDATIDIYNIRIYSSNLNRKQIVNNWIADTQSGSLKRDRYIRNDNYENEVITKNKLPNNIPYIIWDIDPLPQYKGDKRKGQAYYFEPADTSRNFHLPSVSGVGQGSYNVQGTSSAGYPVKNIRLKSEGGFIDDDLVNHSTFTITKNGIGANYFTFKVDYASSEGANNVELTKLYNDASKALGILTPPQKLNSKVRVGIDGYPIVAFHRDSNGTDTFCTKANFNNDKANEEVYGFIDGDESWETTNNSADEANYKKAVTAETFGNAFEIRFPDIDGYKDLTHLKPMTEWVVSTDPEQATNNELTNIELLDKEPTDWATWYTSYLYKTESDTYENVTKVGPAFEKNKYYWRVIEDEKSRYFLLDSEPSDWKTNFESYFYKEDEVYKPVTGAVPEFELDKYYIGAKFDYATVVRSEDGTYTTQTLSKGFAYDTAEYRLTKFKSELKDWFNVDSTIFYYIFTHLYLMIDSRAKNAFPTYFISREANDGGDRWFWLPYDMDTAIGINNEGKLVFDYNLEDTDQVDGSNVFNGQNSVMWNNVRKMFDGEIGKMYAEMRTTGGLISFDETNSRFTAHQDMWSETIFNEDSYIKYIKPLIQNNENYLEMLQGNKAEQRRWWLYNRFKYFDSKYSAGESKEDRIQFRAYGKADITITPYADIYATVSYANSANAVVSVRATRDKAYTLANPLPSSASDQETYIYSASQLKDIGDLSPFMPDTLDVSKAVKLQNLKIGDSTPGYENQHLTSLTLGNNTLLKTLDVRNCTSLATTVDISNCTNIEEVYFDNTNITGLNLPTAGTLKVLHLPDSIVNLTITNQSNLTDLQLAGTSNIESLWIENVPSSVIDARSIISDMKHGSRVRLIGFEASFDTVEEINTLYDLLDTMSGITAQGTATDKAQVQGIIHIPELTYTEYAALLARYNDIQIDYTRMICTVKFHNDDYEYAPQNVDAGNAATAPEDPVREDTPQYHYDFNGWDKDFSCVMTNMDIYATYTSTIREYEFAFDPQSIHVPTPETQIIKYGDKAVEPYPAPHIEGAIFEGWFKEKEGLNKYDFDTPITGAMTVYGKWTDETSPTVSLERLTHNTFKYTLSDNIDVEKYKITQEIDEPTDWDDFDPTLSEYIYTVTNSGTWYVWAKDAAERTAMSSLECYAISKIKAAGAEYNIYEDTSSELVGDFAIQGTNLIYRTAFDEEHYYSFKGYLDNVLIEDGNIKENIQENIEYKSECIPKNFTVHFNTMGEGTAIDDQTITYLHYAEEPKVQYQAGRIVQYWCSDEALTTQWIFDSNPILNETTLYAYWVNYNDPTKITVEIAEAPATITFNCTLLQTTAVDVDWDDAESSEPKTTIQTVGINAVSHTYETTGLKTIKISCWNGQYYLGSGEDKPAIQPIETIKNIEFAWSVATTAPYAFKNATGLTTVEIPKYMSTLGIGMFQNCTNLTEINLPYNLESISQEAFKGCTGITSIKLPSMLKTINEAAFAGCTKLLNIEIPENVTTIDNSAFYDCSVLTTFSIPESVTKLGASVIEGCSSITAFEIPENVTTIGARAFARCSNLEKLIYKCNSNVSIDSYSLDNSNKLITAGPIDSGNYNIEFIWTDRIPAHAFEVGAETTSSSLITAILPNTIIEIGSSAFKNCNTLVSINLPSALVAIGESAFERCTQLLLKNSDLPVGLETIGIRAFRKCERISFNEFPETLRIIGTEAFQLCNSIAGTVVIPSSVESIGNNAFNNCPSMKRIDIWTTSVSPKIGVPAAAWFLNCSATLLLHIQSAVPDSGYEAYGEYWNYYESAGSGRHYTVYADLTK